MNLPLTNAVQGGFLVAIVMTGVIFGGGALVFREVTEGFACLLGGFCFSMWLLTLKPGGLISSSGGKGAFIGVFMIAFWALAWTPYTRLHGLIGCISFSGATAFTLGVDCFTRAGLKEFWFYIWNLNDDLFPLSTRTFPLTRGIKVEIAIIIIGTIIGILSQLKFWKVLRSKEQEMEVIDEESSKQRAAIETALGRHLQRQNDREKSEWERQYGNRLSSQRNTVLWQKANLDKRYSAVSVFPLDGETQTGSIRDLGTKEYGPWRCESSYGSKNMRQSTMTINVIEEVEEGANIGSSNERQKALRALERTKSPYISIERQHSRNSLVAKSAVHNQTEGSSVQVGSNDQPGTPWDPSRRKQLSQQSLSRISKHLSGNYDDNSQSQENLIDDVNRPYSRASSAAATMDVDNEDLDASTLNIEPDRDMSVPPAIVISPAGSCHGTITHVLDPNGEPIEGDDVPASDAGANLERGPLLAQPKTLSKQDGSMSEGSHRTDTEESRTPQSHTSDSANSSADSLTMNALAGVPSQLSNVVLSYRTNEWAKHITRADEPIYDEPETIGGIDDELPTQVLPTSQETEKEKPVSELRVEVPPATTLPAVVQAGGAGVGIASKPPTWQRSFSDQERRRSGPRTSSNSSQSFRHSGGRGPRHSLNPTMQNSLASTPIDEDAPTEFTGPKKSSRRVSAPYTSSNRSSSGSRPQTAHSASPDTSTHDLLYTPRPSTQRSIAASISTGTRMLPSQRHPQTDAQKRESLLAEWRLSQQRRTASTGSLNAVVEQSRAQAQMKVDKDNQKVAEQYQRNTIQQKQYAMDQMMRRPDMQDLHREAMRKMQANANKKLRSASD